MSVGHFRFLSLADILNLPDTKWLIHNIIPEGSFVQLWGSKGVGKTFLTLDWALCVATGTPWTDGIPVQQGGVVYLIGEGLSGFKQRLLAWLESREIEEDDPRLSAIHFVPQIPQLGSRSETETFIKDLAEVCEKPALIIVDTLARASVGADENASKDMGLIVYAADMLRRKTGAALMLLHHSGYEERRGRGSSALPGALDTIMGLEKKAGVYMLECQHQKDNEPFGVIEMDLKRVGSSLVPTVIAIRGEEEQVFKPMGNTLKALNALFEMEGKRARHGVWLEKSGLPHSTFNRVIGTLQEQNFIGIFDGEYYPLEAAFKARNSSPILVPWESHGTGLVPSPIP